MYVYGYPSDVLCVPGVVRVLLTRASFGSGRVLIATQAGQRLSADPATTRPRTKHQDESGKTIDKSGSHRPRPLSRVGQPA
jgi:hypothetical protein